MPNIRTPRQPVSLERARAEQLIKINDMQETFDLMHKEVAKVADHKRKQAIRKHNKATNIVVPNFHKGDLVVVRRAKNSGHKLCFRWFGPCRITAVHKPLVYSITSLTGNKVIRAHCVQILPYQDSLNGKKVSDDMLDLVERTESQYEIIKRIVDIGEADDGIFLRVVWNGLPDERDWTWQKAQEHFVDIPDIVKHFLIHHKNKPDLVAALKH